MGNIGLQLFSLKELCCEDFAGTLEKVAKVGYDGVEFAGYFNLPAAELKKVLDSLGIKACGSHIGIAMLKADLDSLIEYNLQIGSKSIICPALPGEMRDSKDAWKKTAELFNTIGKRCRENGIQFGYHNHAFEFEKFEGEYGYDILGSNTDPQLVHLQIDTFWVEFAGLRTTDFIKKYSNRMSQIHFKDMKSNERKINTEIGKGTLDFKEIVMLCKKFGTQWYIVEQEEYEIPQLQSIEESPKYIRSIL